MPLYIQRDSITEDLQRLAQWKQALGESLRHQKAAQHEIARYNWTANAEHFLERTDLDDAAFAHAVYVLAGAYRETVEQAIAECEREFLEERRAGQR